MVIGLQLPLQALPLDATLGKPQLMDSETIQPLSFGEILKRKEKQLQQEQQVSAASVAAALLSLQTQIMSLSSLIPNIEVSESQTAVDGSPQAAVNAAGASVSSLAAQPTTARLLPSGASDPVAQAFSSLQAMSAAQQTVQGAAVDSSSMPDTLPATMDVSAEVVKTPAANASAAVDRSLMDGVTAQPSSSAPQPVFGTKAQTTATQPTTQPHAADVQPVDNVRVRASAVSPAAVSASVLIDHKAAAVQPQQTTSPTVAREQLSPTTAAHQPVNVYQAVPTPVQRSTTMPASQPVETQDVEKHTLESRTNEPVLSTSIAPNAEVKTSVTNPAVSEADEPQRIIDTSSAMPERRSVAAPVAGDPPRSQKVTQPINVPVEMKPASEPHASQSAVDVRVQNEQQVEINDSPLKSDQVHAETIVTDAGMIAQAAEHVATREQQPEAATRVRTETEVPLSVQRESRVVEKTVISMEQVTPDVEATVEQPGTSRTMQQDISEVAAQNDAAAFAGVKASKGTVAPEKAKVEATPKAVSTAERPAASVRAETLSSDVEQPVQWVTGQASTQVSEKVSPDANRVSETVNSKTVETIPAKNIEQGMDEPDTSPVVARASSLDDKPQPVRGMVNDDVQEMASVAKTIQETSAFERTTGSTPKNDPSIDESVTGQIVRADTVQRDVEPPIVHAENIPTERTAPETKRTATRSVEQPSNNVRTVEAPKVSVGSKERVNVSRSTEVKADTVPARIEQENSAVDMEVMSPKSPTASVASGKAIPSEIDTASAITVDVTPEALPQDESEPMHVKVTSNEKQVVQHTEVENQPVAQEYPVAAQASVAKESLPVVQGDKMPNVGAQAQATVDLSMPVSYSDGTETRPVGSKVQERPIQTTASAGKENLSFTQDERTLNVNTRPQVTVDVSSPASHSDGTETQPVAPKVQEPPIAIQASVVKESLSFAQGNKTQNVEMPIRETVDVSLPASHSDAISTQPAGSTVPEQPIATNTSVVKESRSMEQSGTTQGVETQLHEPVDMPMPVSHLEGTQTEPVEPTVQEQQIATGTTIVKDDPSTVQGDKVQSVETRTQETVDVSRPVSRADAAETKPVDRAAKAVEANVQEKSIRTDSDSTPAVQIVVDPAPAKDDAALDVKTAEPKTLSVEQKETSAPAVDARGTVLSEIPVSTKPVEQVEIKEEIKTRSATSSDEETRPAERRPEMNQMSGSVASANGPVNEAKAADLNGKMPVGQVHAQAAEVAQQVIRQMNGRLKSGSTSMHLQLNPKELGAIEVDMVSSPQGVHVTFFAEQASTGRLLETQLNQLRDALVDSGVQISGLNIGQHNTQGQKGGTFGQDTNSAPLPHEIFVEERQSSAKETSGVERSIGQSSEVDYRI